MTKGRAIFKCRSCGQQSARWVGRCPGCDGWGTFEQAPEDHAGSSGPGPAAPVPLLPAGDDPDLRVITGMTGVDRVLGGGLVQGCVALLAGEPGIGKSTLLLDLISRLSRARLPCLLVSGEESHAQIASRARRLRLDADSITFAPGRDLQQVIATARQQRPFLLAVDSIQTIRDTSATHMPGGVSAVRTCTDALVGMAKSEGIAVLMTGHVTKDGDLAGPRALQHAVDVVLMFEGDAGSGLRVLTAGKNRFGAEGEAAWFEMRPDGLRQIDPTGMLVSGQPMAGAATALPLAGRRALAVEIQALVGVSEGSGRRQATGLDARRFQLVAAVVERATTIPRGRVEIFGATSGGVRVDDPSCDLAVAVAIVSAATGVPPPAGAAFVGEIALTGLVRPAAATAQRFAAAAAAGCSMVFTPDGPPYPARDGLQVVPVRHVRDALAQALRPVETGLRSRSA